MNLLSSLLINQGTYWAIAGPNLAFNSNGGASFYVLVLVALVLSIVAPVAVESVVGSR